MKITQIEVIPYRIPNRAAHHIATLTLKALENVLIRISTDEGIQGWGEAVSEAKWNSTVLEAHEAVLSRYLIPPLIGMDPLNVASIWRRMEKTVNGHYSAKAAIDCALYDLIGHALGLPVWKVLGGAPDSLVVEVEGPGFGIGFMEPQEAAEFAFKAFSNGCQQIEVKGGHPGGWKRDLEVVRAVYEACGAGVSLKLDVTEAYSLKTALTALPRMADFGVEWVEQPLPRHRLKELAKVRDAVPMGIVVEESVGHPSDILVLAELGVCDAVHVKLPMLGGLTMARQVATICAAAGLGVLPGSSTPSGLGLAAVHQFAVTIPNRVRGCHGSPLARAIDDIVVHPIDAFAPQVVLDDTPGMGVDINWEKVERYRIDKER